MKKQEIIDILGTENKKLLKFTRTKKIIIGRGEKLWALCSLKYCRSNGGNSTKPKVIKNYLDQELMDKLEVNASVLLNLIDELNGAIKYAARTLKID